MTRINCVHPSILSNQHLIASWKEYPRIITAVEKLVEKGKYPEDIDIPEQYIFGKGHVTFFYDKLEYIDNSICDVFAEMQKRGMKPNRDILISIYDRLENIPEFYKNDWTPTQEDIYLNMARLVERNFKTRMRVEGRGVIEDDF